MEDYQIRVVEEKKELDSKIEKLDLFLKKTIGGEVDTEMALNFDLMYVQLDSMKTYSKILGMRINRF